MLITLCIVVMVAASLLLLATICELITINTHEMLVNSVKTPKYRIRHARRMNVSAWGGVNKRSSLCDNAVISVVIPAYNEETSISKCVMSVLTQSWKYKQIIIVDDGSKDKTLSVLISLRDKFINDASLQSYFSKDIPLDKMICVVHQENSGKSKAINNAVMNYAIGKYVMILDADSSLGIDAL